jgi:hypothetical protein
MTPISGADQPREDGRIVAPKHQMDSDPRVSMNQSYKAALLLVSLWSAVVACHQAVAPVTLSEALREHVKNDRFQIVTSIRGLPLGVRDALQKLFGTEALDIAESTAEFQVDDLIVNANLPNRRLVAAGCAIEYCLVYYERGGVDHMWHVALFHWTPAATRFEWGGTAPGGLASIDDVRNAILSGAINGLATSW